MSFNQTNKTNQTNIEKNKDSIIRSCQLLDECNSTANKTLIDISNQNEKIESIIEGG